MQGDLVGIAVLATGEVDSGMGNLDNSCLADIGLVNREVGEQRKQVSVYQTIPGCQHCQLAAPTTIRYDVQQ